MYTVCFAYTVMKFWNIFNIFIPVVKPQFDFLIFLIHVQYFFILCAKHNLSGL